MPDDFTSEILMKSMIGLRGRAERLEPDQVVESFSAVGPLTDLMLTEDHQIVFGRRGTGKTHALRYLYATRNDDGDCGVFVDLRNLGSDNSIYNDVTLTISERATRLLLDTLAFIQDGILDYALNDKRANLAALSKPIDRLGDAVSKVRVKGDVTVTREASSESSQSSGYSIRAAMKKLSPTFNASGENSKNSQQQTSDKYIATGIENVAVRFPELSSSLRDVVNALPAKRVWIILDEWSSIPLELQPFLADMLRRAFFTIPKITVKIGAIEHRTLFYLDGIGRDPIGLEVTADIRSNVRLDDYLLFENNKEASMAFFKEFLFRHILSYCKEKGLPQPDSADEVYRKGFNQKTSFEEFVKAAEGVPRDALYIASKGLSLLVRLPHMLTRRRTSPLWLEKRVGSVCNVRWVYGAWLLL